MKNIKDRLYISTVAENDVLTAEKYGLGLEIAEYCTAMNMDTYFAETDKTVRKKMSRAGRFVFHGPFNELCPAAIDPLVVDITKKRYRQAIELAAAYGINRMVIHSGYTPLVYYKEWFTEKSVQFWREFLDETPQNIVFCYENVMEDSPDMPYEIVSAVEDDRFGLCLDIGHASTMVSQVPPEEWVKKYGKLLNHVHLHSNEGKMDLHAPLGTGVIDGDRILEEIVCQAPEATLTIESIDCESSCRWLKEHDWL